MLSSAKANRENPFSITRDASAGLRRSEFAALKNLAAIRAFGIRLRQLREQRGWSQQALADVADVSKPTIQRIEQAKFSVTLDVLISLTRGLEIPLSQLLDVPTEGTP